MSSFTATDFSTKFKTSSGVLLTKTLFYEFAYITDNDKKNVLYTLKDHDYQGYPSLKRLYLEEADLTEYKFAIKYFNDYDHWISLASKPWLSDFVASCRRELELKVRSDALKALINISNDSTITDGNPTKINVLKFLVQRGWKDSSVNKEKKLTKEEILQEANASSSVAVDKKKITDDFDRITKDVALAQSATMKDLN